MASHRHKMFVVLCLHAMLGSLLYGPVYSQNNPDCQAQADIVFIMDSTGSIGSFNYNTMLRFVANLTTTFTLGPKAIQFGAIVFSDTPQNLFNLGTYTDHRLLINAILAAPYIGGSTNTDAALRFARLQSFTTPYGARPGISHIAIVLTDGQSNNPTTTAQEAKFLKDSGVLVLSIGIGSFLMTELQTIASSPLDVFQVNNFNILDTISKEVTNKTCEVVVIPPVQVVACETVADILFILDGSAYLTRVNFNKMIQFVVNVTRRFNIGPNAFQFSTIVFGDTATININFKQFTDHPALEAALLQIPYPAQNSRNTHTGLNVARLQAFTATYGSRPRVPKLAIVITGGLSSNKASLAVESQLLKATGVYVFSVGIGSWVTGGITELQTIASAPNNVFTANTFDQLSSIQGSIANRTCEEVVPPDVEATCNVTQKADILFILDSSGSIGPGNYTLMLNVIVDIVRNFNLGPDGVQFASIIFGTDAQEVFHFTSYITQSALETGILNTPYLQGWTYTDKALRLAREQMFTAAKGSRPGVRKIAIVFTDGQSDNKTGTEEQSRLLKDSGTLVLSIGIGSAVNKGELLIIASAPNDVFEVSDFNVLSTIQKEITNRTCEQVTATSVACEAEADVLFVMDSSSSIQANSYDKTLHFVVDLTRNFNVGPKAFQFGNIIFSDNALETFNFAQHANHSSLEKSILQTPYLTGNAYTDKALQLARGQLFNAATGSRLNVPKVAVVFTHGNSPDPYATKDQAKLLKNAGALVLSVGIGDGVNNQELQDIASFPDDVFLATSDLLLDAIQKEATNRICNREAACDAQADILFIMDSSGSILLNNYVKMLNFVVNVTRNFHVGPKAVQFGNIIFSSTAQEIFDFTTYTNHSSLEQGILSTPYLKGATYTGEALQLARESLFTVAKGSRPNVPKIAIVLTDGLSSNTIDTATQARLLKNSGVQVISIGIGDSVNKGELETMASLPQDVFLVTDFSVIGTIQNEVTNKTCERVTEETADCPAVADILFIMDSTGSIGQENYQKMLTFIVNFTRSFAIGPNWAQFSIVTFADSAYNEFSFTQYTTHSDLEKGILNSTYLDGSTQTDLALKMARELSFTQSNGARPNVGKIAIVLTDGRSNDPALTAQEAQLLKDSGVLVITVAIGRDVLNNELEVIATLPEDVFHVDHFNALESVEREFVKKTCDRVIQDIECEASADILFILDSSASIDSLDYKTMLHFVVNLTRYFEIGPKAVQFSTIIFGDDAHLEFDFHQYTSQLSLEQHILNISYLAENTFTNRALKLAREEAFTAAHGARENVSKIAIVFTDGQSLLPTETTREAQLLKDTGVLVLSVGIGGSVKQSELETIASLPTDVFQVGSFDALHSLQKSLANKTCERATGPQTSACTKHVDIIFLLDSSGSVGAEDYKDELRFAANFTNSFQIGENGALFGAVIFSDTATKLFDLDDYSDHSSILQSLLAAPHLKGGTNTAEALAMISRQGLFNTGGSSRQDASKMLLILTDGQSANISLSLAAAQQLKDNGIQILTIGIGDVVNTAELSGMATTPSDYFQADSYEVLHRLQDQVTNHTCAFVKSVTSTHHACSEKADVIFVFDSSSSITADEYQQQLLFAGNVTQDFDLGPVDAQFAAIAFSNDVFKVFDLGHFSDYLNLFNGILSSPHLTGSTDTGKALNWIIDTDMFGPSYGGRNNASKIVILFIDNPSTDAPAALTAAESLKKDGVHITVVGINNYDLYEIRQIASSSPSAFKATSAEALHWIQRDLVDNICDFASTGV